MTYWNTVGFAELVDHLIENVEGFRYESCSEGGSMKDLFTATKASVINCDDSGDYMSLHMTFYDASYVFHPAQLQLPTVTGSFVQGNDRSTAYSFDYLYGLRASLVGGVMLNFHGDAVGDYATYWPYYVGDLYPNVMRPLIRNGNLYHILPRPDGVHWDGLQYVDLESENEIMGMVLLWKPSNEEGPQKTVKLRGLEADASYQLTFEDRKEQNAVYTGAQLMEGLTVTIEGDFGSEMIWISRA
jgi:alpha-galactosidase